LPQIAEELADPEATSRQRCEELRTLIERTVVDAVRLIVGGAP